MKAGLLAILVLAAVPTLALADRGRHYDRGDRYRHDRHDYRRHHGHDKSRFDISIGFGSGGWDDYSYGHVSYGHGYDYRQRHYYSRPIYPTPVYCPPPVVYYEPCYPVYRHYRGCGW